MPMPDARKSKNKGFVPRKHKKCKESLCKSKANH